MEVYFTTVVRGGPVDQGGELVKVDWRRKRVVRRVPIAPFDPAVNDPNPRGNSRGGRGIILHDDLLWVATYHSLHILDRDLEYKEKLSHPLFVGLHELAASNDRIWASSTSIDGVIGIDFSGEMQESWWPREDGPLRERLEVAPLEIDKKADNRLLYLDGDHLRNRSHLHLNAVAANNGSLFALFNSYGVVYNLTDKRVAVEDPSIKGCHNLVFKDDRILINDTRGRRVMVYDLRGKLVKAIELLGFPEIARIYRRSGGRTAHLMSTIERSPLARQAIKVAKNMVSWLAPVGKGGTLAAPIFVRGLFPLGENRALVGFSPATVVELDYESGRLLDLFQYSDNVEVCPHGLMAVQ